ncbi:hypothetical protein FB45DRAFT_998502 [Roridomyces roridus]|uniref:O-fucosyltransferase family protein n=1 Tax=Roridomyces roridus TaxID=1738132 RepID=A0AAD7CF89_9AGAR|nr:hypothetical protein FB45DRAFT_998502 [Roridomyces roridus]
MIKLTRLRVFVFSAFVVLLFLYYLYRRLAPPYAIYATYTQKELLASLSVIEERPTAKYVLFRQLQGAGFNNQIQEILLFHHLALLTSRVYVYQPLIWQKAPRRASLPLSAFLTGVTSTNSISSAVFDKVCPPSAVVHVSLSRENDALWPHARDVLDGPDRCVVVDDHILHWGFLASAALRPIWPTFRYYLGEHFKWSSHILQMVQRGRPTEVEPYMALHLRRGDFEDHCRGLASSQTGFTTWATLPELADTVFPPLLDTQNRSSVMEHCFPSLSRILQAIDYQASINPHITTLHVLHDGAWDHPTVYLQYYKLEAAFHSRERVLRVGGWAGGPMKVVTHSGSLPVHNGESDWAVALDVQLAVDAAVFVGNGYSSLSTDIIALRLAKKGSRTKDITLV